MLVLAVTCKKNKTKHAYFCTGTACSRCCTASNVCVCVSVCVFKLILSTLVKEAWMHEARGQSHSRTSPAIQVTCFPWRRLFPITQSGISFSFRHSSFSGWDRDSCVADTLPLCFSLFFFFISLSFFSFVSCCKLHLYNCYFTFVYPLLFLFFLF